MRFTIHLHKQEWIVFDNQERLAVLNYRSMEKAKTAAIGCNKANCVVATPYN